MKTPWLKLALAGAVALASLTACNMDDNRQGTGINDNNARTNNVQPLDTNGDQLGMNRWDHGKSNNYVSLHNNTRMQMSQKTANQITAMPEVRSANVLLTDKNAYVAVVLSENTSQKINSNTTRGISPMNNNQNNAAADVSDVVKERIAVKVQSINPDVRNVFVSANPGFVERLTNYDTEFRNGQPLRGMILEFNTAVERLFPQRAATNGTNMTR